MNRESIDTWLERAILVLVCSLLVFGAAAFGAVRPSELVVLWWLVIAIVVLWIVRVWTAPRFRFLLPPICWAVIPFVAYVVWRYRTADIEFLARQELIQIILGALLFLAMVNNLYSQESSRAICFTLVFVAMAVSMYGIYQWLRASDTVWGLPRPTAYFSRASGTFICPNHLAGLLEMILPLGTALAVGGRARPLTRVLLAYASLVILVGIAATGSRGGWLATTVGMFVLMLVLLRTKGQRWIALLLALVIAGAGSWLYSKAVAHRVEGTYLKGHERDIRLRLWTAGWQMWKDNPWWGVGPDHFDYRYRKYREPVDKTQARPGRVHNDYLNTLVDYGAAGLALVLLPLGFAVWSAIRCWPHMQRSVSDLSRKQSNRAAIVSGASAGLVALAVHSFFDFNMHIPSNAFVALALLALITFHIRFATERYWFTARWPTAIAACIVLIASLSYVVPQTITRTQELRLLRRAEALPDGHTDKLALLKRAFALQPGNFETAFQIGAQLRALAFIGHEHSDREAEEALSWFRRAQTLNPWEVRALTYAGTCLDWLGRREEASPYFVRALELDPNYWETRYMMGWHKFQLEHYQEARDWLLKSLQLNWTHNADAQTYLSLSEKMLNGGNWPPRFARPPE